MREGDYGREEWWSRVSTTRKGKTTMKHWRISSTRHKLAALLAVFLAAAVAAGSYAIAASGSGDGTAASPTATASAAAPGSSTAVAFAGRSGSNARSGPAAGGTSGTVATVSGSQFTLKTSAGQKVTVKENSATDYKNGNKPASASAVAKGEPVLVLGTTDSTTITATLVDVRPPSTGPAPSWAKTVVPFQRGSRSASKSVGNVPSSYKQGTGTIVSGTAANKATKAALAVYPGGVVDRVVRLSNGEYEVHYIGVNWPHHIFVSQTFNVVGAD